VYSNYEKMTDR